MIFIRSCLIIQNFIPHTPQLQNGVRHPVGSLALWSKSRLLCRQQLVFQRQIHVHIKCKLCSNIAYIIVSDDDTTVDVVSSKSNSEQSFVWYFWKYIASKYDLKLQTRSKPTLTYPMFFTLFTLCVTIFPRWIFFLQYTD